MNQARAEAVSSEALASAARDSHPKGFWFIFWGEFAERCSYYGMRAILPLYLTAALHMADTAASTVFYWFKMACYLLPLLGGYLADRYFGRYWTIVGFSIPYVLGHFILGIENRTALAVALVLLAAGSGVIKPNISTLMGQTYDQQRPGQVQLLSAAFRWFYLAINIGSLLSMAALPSLRDRWGYSRAFQVPAWFMVLALAVFASGKRHYATEAAGSQAETDNAHGQRWQIVGKLLGIFGLMVFFWIAYEHNDSLWVFFARDYVDRTLPGLSITVPADQIQLLNPLFVLLTIPALNWIFKTIDAQGTVFTPTRRILISFAFGALASGTVALAGYLAAGSPASLSMVWLVVAYVILTVGEVLLYGTGLEMAYAMAPPTLKGFVTACFLLAITLANLINSWWARFYGGSLLDPPLERGPLSPGAFFAITAIGVAGAGIAFSFVGRHFERTARLPT